MKKTYILLLLALLILTIACKEEHNVQGINDNSTLSYSELPKYEHKWVEFRTSDGIKTKETELYISELGDTLVFQNKIFKNEIIDSARSNFLDFKASWLNDSVISGSISVNSRDDYIIKSPLLEKKLTLKFVQFREGKKGTVEFNSSNKNIVNFEFQNDSDSLIGILTYYRHYDTLVNNKESVRIIEQKFPVDNKSNTNNIFIYVNDFYKNKNKR